jgi:hypothetical protein
LQTGSLLPTEDNALMVAALVHENNSGGAVTIDLGFTAALTPWNTPTGSEGGGLAYLIESTATARNPEWDLTNNAECAAAIAWYKADTEPSDEQIDPVFVQLMLSSGIIGRVDA